MSGAEPRGISREGLDAGFEAEELRASNLVLEARLLRAQDRADAAADRFAEAAAIEERLAAICEGRRLQPKAAVHAFSAASYRAQAGDFHRAITGCAGLLSQSDLPEPLREQVRVFVETLRERRARWSEEFLASQGAES